MWEVDQYAKLIDKILKTGEKRKTRNAETYALFGEMITIDIEKEFPLLRGRKMFYRPVLGELAAMLKGPRNIADFKKYGCNYWDAWGRHPRKTNNGEVIPVGFPDNPDGGNLNLDYGNAWIDFNGVNQLEDLIDKLKNDPTNRRMVISGWRPDRLAELSLPCCHMLYQWYVRENKYLDMVWYQRSVDTMVGLPSDIILCAAWNIILATECGYIPGTIKLILGDTHIYSNHLEPALDYLRQLQSLDRYTPVNYYPDKKTTCATFIPDHLILSAYDSQPAIKFELNV